MLCDVNEILFWLSGGCVCWRVFVKTLLSWLSHTPEVQFFTHSLSQVMRETGTQVKWPSKLKIGAKSKKGEMISLLLYITQ